jgi:NO-binding membrane sensor protein with MHYT domain
MLTPRYDAPCLVLSVVVAIAASALAVFVVSRPVLPLKALTIRLS